MPNSEHEKRQALIQLLIGWSSAEQPVKGASK
jgi:hypothetical protein